MHPTVERLAFERDNRRGGVGLRESDVRIAHREQRVGVPLDGLAALKALVEPFRGQSLYEAYEMAEPKVHASGDIAIPSYILVQRRGSASARWNATQVYQRKGGQWRVVHTHWPRTSPPPPAPAVSR